MRPYNEDRIIDQVKEKHLGSAILTQKVKDTSKRKVEQNAHMIDGMWIELEK